MKRREFIRLIGGAVGASPLWPRAGLAQQSPVRPLIGVLSPLSATAATRNTAAFRSGLRDLGYVEGRNATLEIRYGDGVAERMAPLAGELVALKPDVLFAGSERRSGSQLCEVELVLSNEDGRIALPEMRRLHPGT